MIEWVDMAEKGPPSDERVVLIWMCAIDTEDYQCGVGCFRFDGWERPDGKSLYGWVEVSHWADINPPK